MKALSYNGPGKCALEEKSKPNIIAPTDAIVRITRTTICGTDLHILKGDVPSVTAGRILGHEGVGIIDEVGGNVTTFRNGDRVLISCISSCGKCTNCKKGMYSHCESGGGWVLEISSTAPRRSMATDSSPTPACTTFPRAPTKKRW